MAKRMTVVPVAVREQGEQPHPKKVTPVTQKAPVVLPSNEAPSRLGVSGMQRYGATASSRAHASFPAPGRRWRPTDQPNAGCDIEQAHETTPSRFCPVASGVGVNNTMMNPPRQPKVCLECNREPVIITAADFVDGQLVLDEPGTYRLAENVSVGVPAGDAVVHITAEPVTFDLCGFTIAAATGYTGTMLDLGSAGRCCQLPGKCIPRITIKDGTFFGGACGLALEQQNECVCVDNVALLGWTQVGIKMANGRRVGMQYLRVESDTTGSTTDERVGVLATGMREPVVLKKSRVLVQGAPAPVADTEGVIGLAFINSVGLKLEDNEVSATNTSTQLPPPSATTRLLYRDATALLLSNLKSATVGGNKWRARSEAGYAYGWRLERGVTDVSFTPDNCFEEVSAGDPQAAYAHSVVSPVPQAFGVSTTAKLDDIVMKEIFIASISSPAAPTGVCFEERISLPAVRSLSLPSDFECTCIQQA